MNVRLNSFRLAMLGTLALTAFAAEEPDAALLRAMKASGNDMLANPFNKMSAQHRPIGDRAIYGIPAGEPDGNKGPATPARPGERGAIAHLGGIQLTKKVFTKYLYDIDPSWPAETIRWDGKAGGGPPIITLPHDFKVPPQTRGVFRPFGTGREACLGVYDRATDRLFQFYHLAVGADDALMANFVHVYPLGGVDYKLDDDPWQGGSSASKLRLPAGVMRYNEIKSPNPVPIYHMFHTTASYDNNAKGGHNPAAAQVLGRTICWPAASNDGSASKNQGDIPYGTRVCIRWGDRVVRDSTTEHPIMGLDGIMWALNLDADGGTRGHILFDQAVHYGYVIVDGTSAIASPTSGVLQIRTDNGDAPGDQWPGTVYDAVAKELNKIRPLLWPIANTRGYGAETEIYKDGLPYAGGGGPLDSASKNTAWDVSK